MSGLINKIEKTTLENNCKICDSGRLVELQNLKYRVGFALKGWKALFSPTYRKRLKELDTKVLAHQKWYCRAKYKDMPSMFFYKIKGGWLLVPTAWVRRYKSSIKL